MWKLWHHLFGWDFIHLENSATEIVRRVRHTAHGRPYTVYFGEHLVWLDRPNGWTVSALTLRAPQTQSR